MAATGSTPKSLRQLVRSMIIWSGINWILTIALVLFVIFWRRVPLHTKGLRMPLAGDLVAAFGALVALYLAGFVGNSIGSIPNPKTDAALYALPWAARIWILSLVIWEEIMFSWLFHRAR
jgi:hypothetical protein